EGACKPRAIAYGVRNLCALAHRTQKPAAERCRGNTAANLCGHRAPWVQTAFALQSVAALVNNLVIGRAEVTALQSGNAPLNSTAHFVCPTESEPLSQWVENAGLVFGRARPNLWKTWALTIGNLTTR